MSDADRLSEIRARLNAATAGEWHVLRPGDEVLVAGTEANIAFLLAELSRLSEKLAMRTEQTVAAEAETREYRASDIGWCKSHECWHWFENQCDESCPASPVPASPKEKKDV